MFRSLTVRACHQGYSCACLDLQFASFSHVSRVCNVVADALAKKAKTCGGTQVWLEELPEDIASLAGFDVH